MNGFIKLHRQLKEWEWYGDIRIRGFFIHCLLTANFKFKKWRGMDIQRGQFVSTWGNLADDNELTVQECRTIVKKLVETGEIIQTSTNRNIIITVCKYDTYQAFEAGNNEEATTNQQAANNQSTSDQQSTNNQSTTTEEGKEGKEEEEYIYLREFQKIKKGELIRRTQLDKNFNFALFPEDWTENLQNEVLGMFRYLESKDNKPDYWGNLGTIKTQIDVLRAMLKEYTEKQIIKAFKDCKFASKKSWNMYLKNQDSPQTKKTGSYSNDSGIKVKLGGTVFNGK